MEHSRRAASRTRSEVLVQHQIHQQRQTHSPHHNLQHALSHRCVRGQDRQTPAWCRTRAVPWPDRTDEQKQKEQVVRRSRPDPRWSLCSWWNLKADCGGMGSVVNSRNGHQLDQGGTPAHLWNGCDGVPATQLCPLDRTRFSQAARCRSPRLYHPL